MGGCSTFLHVLNLDEQLGSTLGARVHRRPIHVGIFKNFHEKPPHTLILSPPTDLLKRTGKGREVFSRQEKKDQS